MFDPLIFTLVLLVAVFAGLAFTQLSADVILISALALLLLAGVLTPTEALLGFANPGVMTIAVLYVIASGLQDTGAVQWLARHFMGMPRTVPFAQLRLYLPSAFLSAFMSNTTVVAMFIPAVQDWADRLKIPASKLLIPLSYAAILGGTCTLIGTSTNLVLDGLLQSQFNIHLKLFDLAWVGIPIVAVGAIYLYFFGNRLLPVRQNVSEKLEQVRQYCVVFVVEAGGPLIGKSVAHAGLKNMRSGYLAEFRRDDRLLTSDTAEIILHAGDELTFIGAPETAKELRRVQGLVPATGNVHKLAVDNHERCLVEVVIGPDFPYLNASIRDSQFRTYFDAVVLSVSRGGNRLPGKLGDIVLEVGDTLLLEASDQFVTHYRYRRDFMLVSALNDSTPPDYSKAPQALIIVVALVVFSATQWLSLLEAGFLAAGAMLMTGCITVSRARRSIDMRVLVIIAASFALGFAMYKTGAANVVSDTLLPLTSISTLTALIVVYVITVMLTELITNNAAAILMFPIAVNVADQSSANVLPFVIAVMIAASASFITPFGYQTNLMVFGPGQYRFADYVKVGAPLSLLIGVTAIIVIPLVWSF